MKLKLKFPFKFFYSELSIYVAYGLFAWVHDDDDDDDDDDLLLVMILVITCSKLSIEALEQYVKYIQI